MPRPTKVVCARSIATLKGVARGSGTRIKMGSPETTEGGGVSCRLCGLPVGSAGTKQPIGGEAAHFCCHGCHQVFLLLSAATGVLPEGFQETELYRVCVEAGIVPGAAGDPRAGAAPPQADLIPQVTYRVGGMWCPSCAWLLEEVLGRMAGVILAKVTFVSDVLTLKYLPHLVSPAEMVSRVQRLGYRLDTFQTPAIPEDRALALRLGVAAVLTANIMMVSMAVYAGFLSDLPQDSLRYFSYPLLVMGTFVLFYAGLPILERGLGRSAISRRPWTP